MEYEIRPRQKIGLNISEVWEYRELFFFLTWRDIKIKYKQTYLGAAWAILQPLLLMVIFTFVFPIRNDQEIGSCPYPVFFFIGLLIWNVFSSGVSNAGLSMVNNSNIIKKVYFPRLIIPTSAILSALVDFAISFGFLIVLFIYYHQLSLLPALLLRLPLAIVVTFLTTAGLGFLISALSIKYRDFRYIVPFMLQMLFFLSPVIYPVHHFEDKRIQAVLSLNPISGMIEFCRSSVTHTTVDFTIILYSVIASVVIFLAGLIYFRKTEYYFADLA